MYGFSLCIGINCSNRNVNNNNRHLLNGRNFSVENKMIEKFDQDKIFTENDRYVIILDGVILNKSFLERKYYYGKNNSWFQTIIFLYEQLGETFFDQFRGSFAGALYDKQNDKWIIFSDHIGTKFIYYSFNNGILFCSLLIKDIYKFLKTEKINYTLNIENAYLLLTYGYMVEDRTLCDEIKKLQPGYYLVYEKKEFKKKSFYTIDNSPDHSLSEKDSVNIVDIEFRKAIELQFNKDLEYNYKHFVALSGGLDSRMVSWVAHDMGYDKQLNFTFSQTNYLDETVPKSIASYLNHEWIFKSLDDGSWLLNVDEITLLTGGNVLYYGLAHGESLLKYIKMDQLGMIHSGQLGDVVISTFSKTPNGKDKFLLGNGAYSTRFINRIKDVSLKYNAQNNEIASFYYRGFSGANNGLLVDQKYSETFSPFYNVDFLNKILKIPVEYRYKHNLYKKWILTKYPEAANFTWEKIKAKINEPFIKIGNHLIPYSQIPNRILNKIKIKKQGVDTTNHMNPIGYYLNNNKGLNDFFNGYFDNHIPLVQNKLLRNDIIEIKNKGNAIEKCQAITLLSAIKVFDLY